MSESRWAWLLAAANALVITAVALFAPVDGLVKLVPDDGFYYLEIARRIGAGQGSTFDGIHPTNGYHPLWLLSLVPLAPLMELSRLLVVRIALVVGLLAMLLSLRLCERAAREEAPEQSHLAVVWLSCTLMVGSVYGMEAPLAVLFAACLWESLSRGLPATLSRGLLAGLFGAGLFLSRLDGVLLVFAADLVWGIAVLRRRAPWQPLAAALAVEAAAGVGYLAVNEIWFGAWMPVSASLKSSRQGGVSLRWLSSLLSLVGVGSALLAVHALATARDTLRQVVALGTLLSMSSIALGGGRETYNWYFALSVAGGGVLLPGAVSWLVARGLPRRLAHAATFAASLLLLAVAARGKLQETGFQEKIERAQWLSAHAPEDAVFAEGDCGILGYLSGRPFINLDGLTNTPDFLDAVDDGTLAPWLVSSGLNAIALPSGSPESSAVLVARGRKRGQKVRLSPALSPWDPPVRDERYTLWRIRAL